MNIGLLAVDSNYPNLALMKISSYQLDIDDEDLEERRKYEEY